MSVRGSIDALSGHLPRPPTGAAAAPVGFQLRTKDSLLFGSSDAAQFLLITGHDYRSRRKANMHFIAAELAKRGPTRMFSLGFSRISRMKGRDPRLGLEPRANKVELVDGVECYLWMTPVHPGRLRSPVLNQLSPVLFNIYRDLAPPVLEQWIRQSSTILVESGLGVLLIDRVRRLNPGAEILYIASDDMETIGVDPHLIRVFERSAHLLDGARVPSRKLATVIPPGPLTYYVPHGIDPQIDAHADPSPYSQGLHAVSVGSMLFDPGFFHIAAEAFPQVTFHVIGSGAPRSTLPPSVVYHEEMAYERTLPFVKHADLGVAPYRRANLPYYLCDTSMKLIQYEHFGLPAVCPSFVVGDEHPTRFGYEPGEPDSIKAAISAALACKRLDRKSSLSWAEVVDRILDPSLSPETIIG